MSFKSMYLLLTGQIAFLSLGIMFMSFWMRPENAQNELLLCAGIICLTLFIASNAAFNSKS